MSKIDTWLIKYLHIGGLLLFLSGLAVYVIITAPDSVKITGIVEDVRESRYRSHGSHRQRSRIRLTTVFFINNESYFIRRNSIYKSLIGKEVTLRHSPSTHRDSAFLGYRIFEVWYDGQL